MGNNKTVRRITKLARKARRQPPLLIVIVVVTLATFLYSVYWLYQNDRLGPLSPNSQQTPEQFNPQDPIDSPPEGTENKLQQDLMQQIEEQFRQPDVRPGQSG